ncbi:class I SAM-dependent methyltransferase [Pseudomethylobacillus aquaticus]|uniref:Class I SAM-dependent methyltransferase n=1 Tax=Pseudomethylobacillus aquaticus TaxID=2676064 RepID=A0A3N0V6X7_9PROT|nr:class I SAM-dependent methyltransferase [Pseudomethylobacillus aquaticus]ROH88556.1 class I SAM-dependent methyltransferase [Pseudomethylobacillus aquaticus]
MSAELHVASVPSGWVTQHAQHIRACGRVLDLACGSGRHARWLAAQGWQVDAVDRDSDALASLANMHNIQVLHADLENAPWPYDGLFDGIVVTRYLHRALFPHLTAALAPGGVLIYETFMRGHEQYGRPANPDFLLMPDELRKVFEPTLQVLAFEQGMLQTMPPAMLQRICAQRAA